jgi:hypothetical protein
MPFLSGRYFFFGGIYGFLALRALGMINWLERHGELFRFFIENNYSTLT